MSPLRWILLLGVGIAAVHNVASESPTWDHKRCNETEKSKSLKISLRSRRNVSGNWVTEFAAYGNTADIPEGLDLDVKQTVTKCEGKERLLLQGVLGVATDADPYAEVPIVQKTLLEGNVDHETSKSECICPESPRNHSISFHPKKGLNIILTNDGRTAARDNPFNTYRDGIVLTNRALNDGELFEVRLDEVMGKWAGSLEFGVTTKGPEETTILSDQFQYGGTDTWFYGRQEIKNKAVYIGSNENYKVGDRFAVKKSGGGELYFYQNGMFAGSLKVDIKEKIYGIIDIYGKAVKVTILSPS